MTNHVTPDGLLDMRGKMHGKTCEPTIRYRDPAIVLQDECTAEPRLGLSVKDQDGDSAYVRLDVAQATHMIEALREFLAAHIGVQSWRHDGVYYSLEHAWEGRPGTDYEGMWFRYTGTTHNGLPMMRAEPEPGHTYHVSLPVVLGLKRCPRHNVWDAPCHRCIMESVAPVNRSHP